ncbi:MAG: hypothetical protein KBA05_04305 [Anaerolineaceae bacterium]|jgi:hypothetical protein|nr:hypothetical protein [Anaerolineaceae bacterium]MDI9531997.1 hypothetical protein [Chloroflexota bacterium]NLE92525.1 hypothetical protein [Chloroflexota bacterium]HNZ16044.1 hypothetical protein [Anaerolineaceae bacterium]HOF28400.1 hypothetical protein [Anaerolineaceae bacterium]
MTVVIPDNRKKYQLFNRTSAMNLVFMVLLALYYLYITRGGSPLLSLSGQTAPASLPKPAYIVAPPVFGVIGLVLAIAWKPLRKGVIVLLAMHYLLTMSILLLAGFAAVSSLFTLKIAGFLPVILLLLVLAVLVFLFLWNLKALKDLDLPAIFGKQ